MSSIRLLTVLIRKNIVLLMVFFSCTFENKGIILTVTDGGYTSSLLKDDILYTKDYNNVIRERKVY